MKNEYEATVKCDVCGKEVLIDFSKFKDKETGLYFVPKIYCDCENNYRFNEVAIKMKRKHKSKTE